MVRPLKTLRPKPLNLSLDEDLDAKMRIHLFSELENRVPHGAISTFINGLLREHFKLSPEKGKRMLRQMKTEVAVNKGLQELMVVHKKPVAVAEAEPEGGQTDGTQSQEA